MSEVSEKLLAKKRYEGDPLADNAVLAAVKAHGERVLQSYELYRTVKELGSNEKETHCAKFMEFYGSGPPWKMNWKFCELGRRFFVRNSAFAGLVLMYGSLVASFTAASGNKVLLAMGRLSPCGDVRRRLFETLSFVQDVVLGSANDVKEACARVRLLHAAVRYHLCHRDTGWEMEKHGLPVNQEDLAGTLSTFSSVVINGMEVLGLLARESERNAYQNLWKFVGYYLGMTTDLLCNNYEEEWKLCTLIRKRQCKPDNDSIILTESLLSSFASKPPFHLGYAASCIISRHLIGDDLATQLKLTKSSKFTDVIMGIVYWFLRLLTILQTFISPLEKAVYAFGKYSLNMLVEQSLNGRKPSYVMKIHSVNSLPPNRAHIANVGELS